jgi:hypothetical protein
MGMGGPVGTAVGGPEVDAMEVQWVEDVQEVAVRHQRVRVGGEDERKAPRPHTSRTVSRVSKPSVRNKQASFF